MLVDLQIFYSMASEMVSVVDIFQPMFKGGPSQGDYSLRDNLEDEQRAHFSLPRYSCCREDEKCSLSLGGYAQWTLKRKRETRS
jgi:hypothetical protein